jgi:hypothetical protein
VLLSSLSRVWVPPTGAASRLSSEMKRVLDGATKSRGETAFLPACGSKPLLHSRKLLPSDISSTGVPGVIRRNPLCQFRGDLVAVTELRSQLYTPQGDRKLTLGGEAMVRRIVVQGQEVHATREVNARITRKLTGGCVLNMLQWVRPSIARFTIEGEGADVWFCDEAQIDRNTLLGRAAGGI